MRKAPRLLGISGSLRLGSFNTMLVENAARCWPDAEFDRADLRLPLYDADVEAQGIPAAVARLAEQITAADGVVIATPEYNKGISGVLKNALDWISRVEGNPWAGKPVVLMSATAGRSGGERATAMTVACLWIYRPRFVPGPEVLVAGAHRQFDNDRRLTEGRYAAALSELMQGLRKAAGR